ncbi:MAG TPA: hypothetical protein VLE53_02820 [Gemmatimonadaceae bacterium]|nr:hypothetical protein [Gemmatimonadaceae bacterium]
MRMRGLWCLTLAGSALFTAGPRQARAQLGCSGATCTVEISMPVQEILRLTLSATGVALGSPVEADFQAGYRDVAGPAVTVTMKGNRPFQVQLQGMTPLFTYTGVLPDPLKPASQLLWATSAAGLAGTPDHMGASGTFFNGGPGSFTQPLFLRTLWNFGTDVPGTYAVAIQFTLSAP